VTGAVVERESDLAREHLIAEALRAQWRMIERVSLTSSAAGSGFEAIVHLNRPLMRAAAEQQGLDYAAMSVPDRNPRLRAAISGCVERVNARLSPGESIRGLRIVG